MRNRKKVKQNIPMMLACILFSLTLISMHLTGGLYAKYRTQDSAEDSARVVKFNQIRVMENEQEVTYKEFIFQPGVNLEKDITVYFDGAETDTYIFVKLDAPSWTTGDMRNFVYNYGGVDLMSWAVYKEWTYLTTTDGSLVYYYNKNGGRVDTNQEIESDFIAGNPEGPDSATNKGAIVLTENGTNEIHAAIAQAIAGNTLDIEINITAYVIQAGGFTNAEDAWNALSS